MKDYILIIVISTLIAVSLTSVWWALESPSLVTEEPVTEEPVTEEPVTEGVSIEKLLPKKVKKIRENHRKFVELYKRNKRHLKMLRPSFMDPRFYVQLGYPTPGLMEELLSIRKTLHEIEAISDKTRRAKQWSLDVNNHNIRTEQYNYVMEDFREQGIDLPLP